jgi:DNA (cytosine-5)-methyltransferase 1
MLDSVPTTRLAHAKQGRPVAIDLFSGAGGLSLGLEHAGFDVRLGLDFDKHALATYARNHDSVPMLADVTKVRGSDLIAEAGVSQVDLLAGGPSCQGFSTHGKRIADDPRNFLYVEFMRLVGELEPTTVLIENVKGLLSTGKGAYKREIFESFAELGYSVDARVLHAVDFGVPQRRHRVFFVATRLGGELRLPSATHGAPDSEEVLNGDLLPYITLSEAISDLEKLATDNHDSVLPYDRNAESDYQLEMRGTSSGVRNQVVAPLSPLAHEIVSQLQPGQGLRSLPPERLPERFKRMRTIASGALRRDCTTLYHRLSMAEPAYTITCNFRNVSSGAFTHPNLDRSLTPREAARVQSFPDSFEFVGASIPRQIGNAVPPRLGRAVGAAIHEHLAAAN